MHYIQQSLIILWVKVLKDKRIQTVKAFLKKHTHLYTSKQNFTCRIVDIKKKTN